MSLTVKAHLYEEWVTEPIETRRFALDQDVATNYTYLTEKLARTFSNVKADDIVVSYLDSDGDRITVSSDEELTDALDQFDGTVFRLHIKKKLSDTSGSCPFIPPAAPFMRYGAGPTPRRGGGWCGSRPAGWGASHGGFYPRGGRPFNRRGCPYWQKTAADNNDQPKTKEGDNSNPPPPMEHDEQTPPTESQTQQQSKDESPTTNDQPQHEQRQGDEGCCGWQQQQSDNPWAEVMAEAAAGRPFNLEALAPLAPLAAQILGGLLGGQTPPWCGQQQQNGGGNTNQNEGGEKMETGEPNESFKETLEQLKTMGFTDEGGWLYELVKAKGGDLQKILDALHPTGTNTED